ncbi:MAG: Crp/Fnr family transcriptional regulator [Thermodesulfobacteriota bacterium]
MSEFLEKCKHLKEKVIEPYQVIIEEGGRSSEIYILIEGTVVIERDGVEITVVSESGSIFGEISILLDLPHMATVKTASPCRFYVADNGLEFLESDIEISLSISKILAKRLRGITFYLVDLKYQNQVEDTYHFTVVDSAIENLLQQKDYKSDRDSVKK